MVTTLYLLIVVIMVESFSITNILVFSSVLLSLPVTIAGYLFWRRLVEEKTDKKAFLVLFWYLYFIVAALFVLGIELENVESIAGISDEINWFLFFPCAVCPSFFFAVTFVISANNERMRRQAILDIKSQGPSKTLRLIEFHERNKWKMAAISTSLLIIIFVLMVIWSR